MREMLRSKEVCKNCIYFSSKSDFPNYHKCLHYGFYFNSDLAETQALCEEKFTPRDTQVSTEKRQKNDAHLASMQLKIKCRKCGSKMLPKADGAHLFRTVAFLCPKCLYEVRLKKPIYHPPDLNQQRRH